MMVGKTEKENPHASGRDYVGVIPRNPRSLFVFWELTGPRSEHYRKVYGREAEWCLALIKLDNYGEITGRSEIPVDPKTGNYYLNAQPGQRYRLELGVRVGNEFHPACHSLEHLTPVDHPSPTSGKPDWLEVGENHEKALCSGKPDRKSNNFPAGLRWEEDLLDNTASS